MKKNDKMIGFAGFPAGKQPTTSVPNQFFSDLLPLIDNLVELKITLHLFWLIGRKQGELRYARLDELLQDDRLMDGLSAGGPGGRQLLLDGLERAVARGALIHATVQRGDETEEWYMVNSAHGRDVMERLSRGDLDVMAQIAEDVQLQVERPTIFVLYEQNIGILTPMIADELRDAEKHYPAEWLVEAVHEAVTSNKRSWRYVLRILERWRTEGRGAARPQNEPPPDEAGRKRLYVPKGYEDLIEH